MKRTDFILAFTQSIREWLNKQKWLFEKTANQRKTIGVFWMTGSKSTNEPPSNEESYSNWLGKTLKEIYFNIHPSFQLSVCLFLQEKTGKIKKAEITLSAFKNTGFSDFLNKKDTLLILPKLEKEFQSSDKEALERLKEKVTDSVIATVYRLLTNTQRELEQTTKSQLAKACSAFSALELLKHSQPEKKS